MRLTNEERRDRAERALFLVTECADVLFEHAPVMMHRIGEDGILVKVNQRWLTTMGYQADEVLGRKSIDFLTEESRAHAQATLPLFWRVGEAHSVGYGLRRKDGRVLDFLLDAVASGDPPGSRVTLAALRSRDDLTQWRQATTTIKALQGLEFAQRELERLLSNDEPSSSELLAEQEPNTEENQSDAAKEPHWEFLAVTQRVESAMRAMVEVEEQRLHDLANQRQKQLLLAETIASAMAAVGGEADERQRLE